MTSHLLFVTGKGGVGKTTIAAALARRLAETQRVLLVEIAADRSLAHLLGLPHLPLEPMSVGGRLDVVRIDARTLVERYFRSLLRVRFLADRLFASATFNAVTTAAPGVSEFLTLERILGWTEPGRLRRRGYERVIVDAPATGHALRLLRTPRQIASIVPGGPVGSVARRLLGLLCDPNRTSVTLVSIPDEMSVNETLEAQEVLAGDLTIALTRPVLNRAVPRRFDRAEERAIVACEERGDTSPLIEAALLQIAARHDVERHLRRLRRVFGHIPISVRRTAGDHVSRDLDTIGRTLERALG